MNVSFQKPNVWARVFSNIEPAETDAANRLQTSFQSFRNRSAKLLERIATSLPSLTVHDITHIDALWETASLIIGPSYPLNPMEVYMLGGAMLLHDAALCFEAYKDGLVGIRRTQYWQDAYSAELDRNKERNEPLHDAELQANADFSTVRLLHADQAPALVEAFWLDNDTSNQIFLIDDTELRKHFGSIIGQIAASHNWNIEDLGRVDKVDSQISGGVIQDCILESSFGSRPDDGSRVGVLRAFCDHHRQQAGTIAN